MNTARLFKNGNKTLVVLIDHNRDLNTQVWFSIEIDNKSIDSGFMSLDQYKQKVNKENWIQEHKDNYRLLQ